MRYLICLAVVFLVALGSSPARAGDEAVHYELDNGLDVHLRPVASAADVAVCVLYDVGDNYDPSGKSGLAHLVEHLYVTAAAGDVPARTARELMEAYPRNWNAQTGWQHTIFAFIVPPDALEAEVRQAALRMSDLRITQADLDREIPRVRIELSNMFDRFPSLVGRNRARERVWPSARKGRKSGVPADVAGMTLEDVTSHYGEHYKPVNARLVVAGAFDAEKVRGWVETYFAPIPGGAPPPEPGGVGKRDVGEIVAVRAQASDPSFPGCVSVAYVAPAHDEPIFPAFTVLVGRLFGAQTKQALPDDVQVTWAPLDEPEVFYVEGPMKKGETPAEAEARIREVVRGLAAKAPGLADRALARQRFAPFLGTAPYPDVALQGNPYLLAFGVARRAQMEVDGEALGTAIMATDEAAFRAMAEQVLSPATSAAVAVTSR